MLLLTLSAHAQRGLQYLVCVSVCLSVCVSTTIVGLQAAHAQRGLQYLVCVSVCLSVCVSTTIVGLQAAHAHRGLIMSTGGYVSKSSATLNPLTIKQLACELRGIIGRGRRCLAHPIN